MNNNQIAFSDDGSLINPPVHDADLFGILSCPSRRMLLLLRDIHGKVHCLSLLGVERFRGDDFRQGNIVLDIEVQTGPSVNREDLASIYDTDASSSGDFLEKIIRKFNLGQLILVRLDPSYGCSFLCVCERIEIVEDWVNAVASRCS
jgi:hypothetical protein